jgi:hypothetical protein
VFTCKRIMSIQINTNTVGIDLLPTPCLPLPTAYLTACEHRVVVCRVVALKARYPLPTPYPSSGGVGDPWGLRVGEDFR